MKEASKAARRRAQDAALTWADIMRGRVIDVGAGDDPVTREQYPAITEVVLYDHVFGHQDAQTLPEFGVEEFDTLHASNCLEHMRNPYAALWRWIDAVCPGGHIVITVPDEDMYEQGVFPSQWNGDHKTTWSLWKKPAESWSHVNVRVEDLINCFLSLAEPIIVRRITDGWDRNRPGVDQTFPEDGPECCIEFVLRKRKQPEAPAISNSTMKLFLLSPFEDGAIDGVSRAAIYDSLPLVDSMLQADAVVVPISYYHQFQVSPALARINKPIICFDFLEYFGQLEGDTHLLDRMPLPKVYAERKDFQELSDILHDKRPAVYFKRELFANGAHEAGVHPVEWPCVVDIPARDDQATFANRPFEAFNCWGLSHPARARFHGDTFFLMADRNIDVYSHWEQLPHSASSHNPRKWISIHSPHTNRRHIQEVLQWQYQSKCSVTLPGAGVKCFRSTESPVNAIPVTLQDKAVWSIPWKHGVNCIRLKTRQQPLELADYLLKIADHDLFAIYREAQDTVDRYRADRYVAEYIIPTIEEYL